MHVLFFSPYRLCNDVLTKLKQSQPELDIGRLGHGLMSDCVNLINRSQRTLPHKHALVLALLASEIKGLLPAMLTYTSFHSIIGCVPRSLVSQWWGNALVNLNHDNIVSVMAGKFVMASWPCFTEQGLTGPQTVLWQSVFKTL